MAKFGGLVDTPTKKLAKSTFAFRNEVKVTPVHNLEDHSNSQIKQEKPLKKQPEPISMIATRQRRQGSVLQSQVSFELRTSMVIPKLSSQFMKLPTLDIKHQLTR